MKAVFGFSEEVTQAEYKDSEKALKDNVRALNGALEGNWVAGGESPTVADFCLSSLLCMAFQTVLEQGFCKSAPKATAWFKRCIEHPSFIAINGKVQMCARPLKPILKAEEKKVKPAPVVAKPKEEKKEKKKEGLDALPECDFDLYNYKTFLVNEKDIPGVGMARTKEMFQSPKFNDGFSFWWVKY